MHLLTFKTNKVKLPRTWNNTMKNKLRKMRLFNNLLRRREFLQDNKEKKRVRLKENLELALENKIQHHWIIKKLRNLKLLQQLQMIQQVKTKDNHLHKKPTLMKLNKKMKIKKRPKNKRERLSSKRRKNNLEHHSLNLWTAAKSMSNLP